MISNYVKSDILPCLKVKGFDVFFFENSLTDFKINK